jgi:hypothetical protein
MKIYLKVKPEAHERVKASLDKEIRHLYKAYIGLKGAVLRKLSHGANPLYIRYNTEKQGEFNIELNSIIGDGGFFGAFKHEITKEFGPDIIELTVVKEP